MISRLGACRWPIQFSRSRHRELIQKNILRHIFRWCPWSAWALWRQNNQLHRWSSHHSFWERKRCCHDRSHCLLLLHSWSSPHALACLCLKGSYSAKRYVAWNEIWCWIAIVLSYLWCAIFRCQTRFPKFAEVLFQVIMLRMLRRLSRISLASWSQFLRRKQLLILRRGTYWRV